MEQYNGIKHADDTNDAFFIAELLRLKILPTGQFTTPSCARCATFCAGG